jgi:uncharacterized protein HemX
MPPPDLMRCRLCRHRIPVHADRCPYCGKVYKKNLSVFLLVVLLVVIGIGLIVFSFSHSRQQTYDTQKQFEEAAKEAGIR